MERKIKKVKVVGIQNYHFGATKGFVKTKMNRAIDVKTRFASNDGKCDDDLVSILIRGVVATNEKIRILNFNELASKNEVHNHLQTAWLTFNNDIHEKYPLDVPLFGNKNNGNMIAWVKKVDNKYILSQIKIRGLSVLVV